MVGSVGLIGRRKADSASPPHIAAGLGQRLVHEAGALNVTQRTRVAFTSVLRSPDNRVLVPPDLEGERTTDPCSSDTCRPPPPR
jgi:hypothetical protein